MHIRLIREMIRNAKTRVGREAGVTDSSEIEEGLHRALN